MNLTQDSIIWDPFCGLGRTLIGGVGLKETLIGSDKDGHILNQSLENIGTAKEIISSKNLMHTQSSISLFAHDVRETIDYSKLPESGFSIVTEGYLGPALSKEPDDQMIQQLFGETIRLWTKFFKNTEMVNLKDIVMCIPAYRQNGKFVENNRFFEVLHDIVPTHHRPSAYSDIYARADAIVGHQILYLLRK
jgi:tRNA G10  N-methylase Trm11